MSTRPEHTSGGAEDYYDATEAKKYTERSRVVKIQTALAERALELLNFPDDDTPRVILDIGCGSGLSGNVLTEAGHWWVGLDISKDMLGVALENEVAGDLLLADMGHGFGFRPGMFDGVISVSALQWLCYSSKKNDVAHKRVVRFFHALYRALRRGGRAALQLYPETPEQLEMVTTAAMSCGFSGGVVVDFPHSTKAKKIFLCLFAGSDGAVPEAKGGAAGGAGGGRRRLSTNSASEVDLSSRGYFLAREVKVIANRELRKGGDGSTRHIELNLKSTGITYKTADNAALCPENDPDVVESLIKWLDYDADRAFNLEPVKGDSHKLLFPTPCTVREALLRYCDINHMPRKGLLGIMANFATVERERERLLHLISKEGRGEYHEWVTEHRRSFVEVVQAFPSVRMPFERLIEALPRLQVRYYTISSSSLAHPERLHLTVSIVKEAKPRGPSDPDRHFLGVCSNYLARMEPPPTGDDGKRKDGAESASRSAKSRPAWPAVRLFIRPSTFELPADPSTPIIMVGPGTGIAPMRAFLHERHKQREDGKEVGPTVLFFGCRRQAEDFIYEDELLKFARDGTLTEFYTAFSREQTAKVYVQDKLAEHGDRVWALLSAGAHFYVCGGIKMGNDVSATLAKIAATQGGMSEEDAKQFVHRLGEEGRYVAELWS